MSRLRSFGAWCAGTIRTLAFQLPLGSPHSGGGIADFLEEEHRFY